jgi:8-oxo-dGTP diphosphatase
MKTDQFYDFIIKVQAIAKIGKTFSKDQYALDNYKQLETLSTSMLQSFTSVKFDRPNYFSRDIYPTPNVSVRVVIFNDSREILLIKEASDGGYMLPGGWCDLYESPKQAAISEVKHEAGVDIEIVKLVGIINRTPNKGVLSVPEYAIIFLGQLKGDFGPTNHETSDVNFFDYEKLPTLSPKVTTKEVRQMILASLNNEMIFD